MMGKRRNARRERKRGEDPDYVPSGEKLRDYSKCLRDTVKKAFRIEGPCISACETGELGTMPLGQHMFPGSGIGSTAVGMGGGAVLGLGFALMEMLGERAMEETQDHERGHEHYTHDSKKQLPTNYVNPGNPH